MALGLGAPPTGYLRLGSGGSWQDPELDPPGPGDPWEAKQLARLEECVLHLREGLTPTPCPLPLPRPPCPLSETEWEGRLKESKVALCCHGSVGRIAAAALKDVNKATGDQEEAWFTLMTAGASECP